MKYVYDMTIANPNVVTDNVKIANKANYSFQLKGLATKVYINKNRGLGWKYAGIAMRFRETNRILKSLKQRGSSIMFFKILTRNIPTCWGTGMNGSLHFDTGFTDSSQSCTAIF